MKLFIISLLLLFSSMDLYSQNIYNAVIKDRKTNIPVTGVTASVAGTNKTATSGTDGTVMLADIPDGKQVIEFLYPGYARKRDSLVFPLQVNEVREIFLSELSEEMEEVVITSTRSSRTIENIPSRVEFIADEELDEKANMKPGDIRMMLSESTGIQTQQTSATSANSSIRIQGLDGRYTQLLKDGLPLYSGAAAGLGLLQTAPLDLKQVEIIKGSASTLYGGGAIAGLVNLISRTPTDKKDLRFLINGTSASGLDLSSFYGNKLSRKVGLTLFVSHNSNAPYDPAGIDLTAIPKFERYSFNPKLFLYLNDRTTIDLGVNTSFENRIGGDIHYIKGDLTPSHTYFEKNKTRRISTQLAFHSKLNERGQITVRNSYSFFDRIISIPDYVFSGVQNSTFTEGNYSYTGGISEWVAGLNLLTDGFKEEVSGLRNYHQITGGAFIQNTLKAASWLDIETGLRADLVRGYGSVLLPRFSALLKINRKLSSRFGGGLGYKAPTIFTEEGERIQYKDVLPVSTKINKLERSYGVNLDVNYKTFFSEDVSFSLNHLFFYTYLNYPLTLSSLTSGSYQFQNRIGHIDTKGIETNIKLGFKDFKLFLGYTLTDAKLHEGGILKLNPLTPKHRINSVLMYEVEDKWKIGLEAYSFSRQMLSDGTTGRSYWTNGFMAERLWDRFSLFINFENYLDTRQTRFGSIYSGSLTKPVFKDIYAPLDGFVVNGGIKLKLY